MGRSAIGSHEWRSTPVVRTAGVARVAGAARERNHKYHLQDAPYSAASRPVAIGRKHGPLL